MPTFVSNAHTSPLIPPPQTGHPRRPPWHWALEVECWALDVEPSCACDQWTVASCGTSPSRHGRCTALRSRDVAAARQIDLQRTKRNVQRSTPNFQLGIHVVLPGIGRWKLNVGRWKLSLPAPATNGPTRLAGLRPQDIAAARDCARETWPLRCRSTCNVQSGTSNAQRSTPNAQRPTGHPRRPPWHWALEVECWALEVEPSCACDQWTFAIALGPASPLGTCGGEKRAPNAGSFRLAFSDACASTVTRRQWPADPASPARGPVVWGSTPAKPYRSLGLGRSRGSPPH